MQTTIIMETDSRDVACLQILTLSRGKQDFLDLFDSLIEKLEIILEKHNSWTDDLSKDLFAWGDKAIALADLDQYESERVKEVASKHLGVLEELLISTQIDLIAHEANLPLNLKIHAFSQEMFNWMKEAQHLLDYNSNSEVVNSLQKVNLSVLPTSVALRMYHHLRSNQKKIEEVKADLHQMKATPIKTAPSLSSVKQSLIEEIREAKAEMATRLIELEELTNSKIEIMKEKHKIEMELAEFRLNSAESDLHKLNIQLVYAEKNNELNAQKISRHKDEIGQLKNRVKNLENELDDNGGCIIS